MRRGQSADRAQCDDEEIRSSRVRAGSTATAIPVVIGGKAMQVSAMPYGPRYYRYHRYYPC
jgi:hypothetical protein